MDHEIAGVQLPGKTQTREPTPKCRCTIQNIKEGNITRKDYVVSMNEELYYQLVQYLENNIVPVKETKWRQQLITRGRKDFEYQDGELYKISPKDKEYRKIIIPTHRVKEILSVAHDHHLSGHQGTNRTYQQLAQIYWWPQMIKDVQHYIKTCDICQKRKTHKDTVPRQPM